MSWAAVIMLPQIKLNLQLSSCASFRLTKGHGEAPGLIGQQEGRGESMSKKEEMGEPG